MMDSISMKDRNGCLTIKKKGKLLSCSTPTKYRSVVVCVWLVMGFCRGEKSLVLRSNRRCYHRLVKLVHGPCDSPCDVPAPPCCCWLTYIYCGWTYLQRFSKPHALPSHGTQPSVCQFIFIEQFSISLMLILDFSFEWLKEKCYWKNMPMPITFIVRKCHCKILDLG